MERYCIKSFLKWMSCLWFQITHPSAKFVCGKNVLLTGITLKSKLGGVSVRVGDNVSARKLKIFAAGKGNLVLIHDGCKLRNLTCWMEGDGNIIEIGANTSVHGTTQLAACDGSKIIIGEDCLFSHNIYVRTTDSHSIIDDTGKRINMEEDITIGNHVWIGMQSLILKGATVPDNCIIGARSTVTKAYIEPNSIVAGAPARVIKQNINWKTERVSI